jgi:plasmid stability protein
MPSLVVRNLDENVIKALKARAAAHHRSTEAEHRAILTEVLMRPRRKSFAEVLSLIPDVGNDTDFQRIDDENGAPNVFD